MDSDLISITLPLAFPLFFLYTEIHYRFPFNGARKSLGCRPGASADNGGHPDAARANHETPAPNGLA